MVTEDGQRLDFAGRELQFVHTPGHALHHHAIVDVAHGNIFTGDTFGLSYRECDTAGGAFIVPTTTPTQFDPEQLIASVRRLAALKPKRLFSHALRGRHGCAPPGRVDGTSGARVRSYRAGPRGLRRSARRRSAPTCALCG